MEQNYLSHFGIKGMKWGIRRFQKKNGGLTAEGKKRYGDSDNEKNPREEELTIYKNKLSRSRTMTDKKAKAAVELDILKKATSRLPNDEYVGGELSSILMNLTAEKSGTYYFFDPDDDYGPDSPNQNSTQAFRKAAGKLRSIHYARHDLQLERGGFSLNKDSNKKLYGKDGYEKKLADFDNKINKLKSQEETAADEFVGVQLRDIGFEDTRENRKAGRDAFIWD